MIQKPQVLSAGCCASLAALGTGEVPGTRGRVAPGNWLRAELGPAPAADRGVSGDNENGPGAGSAALGLLPSCQKEK